MGQSAKGFAFIELVMIVIILGILAATAVPRFVDPSGGASQATRLSGALSSGNAINYATYLARRAVTDGSADTLPSGSVVDTRTGCTAANASALLQEALPVGYTVAGPTTLAMGQSADCSLDGNGIKLSFVMTGAR